MCQQSGHENGDGTSVQGQEKLEEILVLKGDGSCVGPAPESDDKPQPVGWQCHTALIKALIADPYIHT